MVTLSPSLIISNQSIGVASTSSGFSGVDGILGIGPVDLTSGTVSGESTVPTVSDNLFSEGAISTEVIGISYNPTSSDSIANGELTFGGTDASKYTGAITYTPLTTSSSADEYWGISQSLSYGSSGTSLLKNEPGIVDTGTTLLLISTAAYIEYILNTGASPDETTGLLKISSSNYSKLKSLYFTIGGTTFEFTANAQTWPRALNAAIGGSTSAIYLVVGDVS